MSCGSTCCNITYGYACPNPPSTWIGITQGNGLPALSNNWNCVTINGNPPVVGDTFLDSSSNSGNAPGNGHIYKVLTVSLPSSSQYPRNFNSQSCPAPPPPPPPPPPIAIGPCINPITGIKYQIGDTGPGGGIVFSIPGQGNNNTNYHFEVAPVDVSTTQRAQVSTTLGTSFDCDSDINAIPGAEFGVYKEMLGPPNNSPSIGDGFNNTIHLNSYPTSFNAPSPNPTNPVLDIHDLAAQLCVDYVGPNGHTDWFLPSLQEMYVLASNLSPTSTFNNIINVANLSTSTSHPASAFYWTSTAVPNTGVPSVIDTKAGGFNVVTGSSIIMDRCSTGSVRPVRMFDCTEVGIDYNYRYNGHGSTSGVGGVYWFGADQMGFPPSYQGGNPAQNLIGAPFLYLYFSIFDVRLNKSHPNYHPGLSSQVTGPHNPLTPPENWYGSSVAYPSGFPSNPYKITIYNLEEQLVGSWTYSDVYGIGSCNVADDCYFYVALGNPTPDPGTPTLYDCASIPQPPPLNYTAFVTPCGPGQTYAGTYPYYILVENIATQEIMTSPLGNSVGNTVNLTNYAGTGINMRFIDNYGNTISPTQDFQYHKVCCPSDYCGFWRWLSELPPTHPSFANVTCISGNITPLMDKQLYPDCAAASLACLPSGGVSKLANVTELQTCGIQSIFRYNELRLAGAEVEAIYTHSDGEIKVVSIPPLPEEGRLKLEKQVNALIKSEIHDEFDERNILAPPIIASPGKASAPCPPNFRMIKSYDIGAIDALTGLPSTTIGEPPGVAFGLVGTPGWSVQEPHFRCIGFNTNVPMYGLPPLVGQCYTVELHSSPGLPAPPVATGIVKTFRITEVLPGNTNNINGGHIVQGTWVGGACRLMSLQSTQATIPTGNWNQPSLPGFWPGLRTACTNKPCRSCTHSLAPCQECDQSLTQFSPIQSPQYGCNYQAVGPLLPGQPCTQTLSCAPGYVWSTVSCNCEKITLTPTK